jgi:MinD superfamily P-loop ATPase
MVAALHNADYVLMVTEPTPFGLHDLKLAVETVREIGIPCAVIINRSGSNDGKVEAYCASNNLPILLKIPDNRKVAEGYSRGETLVQSMPEISAGLLDVLENVENTFK